jgi:hypothetical protein
MVVPRSTTYWVIMAVGLHLSAVAELLVCPFDTPVKAGEQVRLLCAASSSDHMLRWFRGDDVVYSGSQIYPPFADDGRYRVHKNETGSVDLYIDDVRLSDAGAYRCIDMDDTKSVAIANVIVVDRVTRYAEERDTTMRTMTNKTCQFQYKGLTQPKLEWLDAELQVLQVLDASTRVVNGTNVTAIESTTTSLFAVDCRLTFQIFNCGHNAGTITFRNRELTALNPVVHAVHAGNLAPDAPTSLHAVLLNAWAFAATGFAVLFMTCTIVMCCRMKTRKRIARQARNSDCKAEHNYEVLNAPPAVCVVY